MLRAVISFWLILFGSPALASVTVFEVSNPRPFGYFLGDTLVRSVSVETDEVTVLQSSALPRPGALNYWLDLTDVDHQSQTSGRRTRHTITLKYQMFYAPLEPKPMTIPAMRLMFAPTAKVPGGEAGSEARTVPAFSFLMSPLRQIMSEKSDDPAASPLQSDARATLLPTGRLKTAALTSMFALAGAITGLLWHYALWPFGKRVRRPFTVAHRRLVRELNGLPEMERYQAGLMTLHRAMDAAGGQRMLAGDLDAFLGRHPEFSDMKDELEAFFKSSNIAFFAEMPAEAFRRFDWDSVLRLSSALARGERAAA